jgi:hypothetical protein
MNQQDLMSGEAKRTRYMGELDRLQAEGKPVRSFKVGVLTPGDRDWCFNGMRYRYPEAAERAGTSLALRWTAVRDIFVLPSEDEPNNEDTISG